MDNKYNIKSTDSTFMVFWRRHLILCNSILIIIAIPIISWIALLFIDIWTHHGETTIVPNVKALSYENAVSVLQEADLKVVISDSIYDLKRQPGEVVEVFPKPGAVVKPGREVYLTIVSFMPKQITINTSLTDQSFKAVRTYLLSEGINENSLIVKYIPSQYHDLVLSVKYNGHNVDIGSKIPVNATLTIEVGKVEEPTYSDISINDIDSTLIEDENSEVLSIGDEPETYTTEE